MAPTDVFVPDGDSRKDTAIVLVGTADEHGIDQRLIRAVQGGFYIPAELDVLIYGEIEEPPAKGKKTSGNRAAKNTVTEKE